jgi:16S rRNA processing protein RimM
VKHDQHKPVPSSDAAPPPLDGGPGETQSWVILASILRPQGRKGEVLAELLTDYPERFEGEPRVYLAKPGFDGPEAEARAIQVSSFFLPVGRNNGRIVLHFAGIDSINAAETLAGFEVIVPEHERVEAEEDAAFISDLLDCAVFDVSCEPELLIGTVDDVHLPTTPDGSRRLEDAAPLLAVVTADDEEILIPFVKAWLVEIEPEAKRIRMRLPDGLVEVNSKS